MATSGYNYPDVEYIGQDPSLPGGLEPSFQQSPPPLSVIAIAKADVACKKKTDYEGIHYNTEANYQNTLIEKNAPALTELQTAIQRQIHNANNVNR